VTPVAARADFGAVEGAIERLASTNMQALTAENVADLKAYGLDKPTATMVIKTGSSAATLILGKTENSVVYAKDVSRPMVFTVEPALLEELKKKPEDLRRKDIFEFRAFSALGAALTIGGRTIELEKQKGAKPSDPNAPIPDVWQQLIAAGAEPMTLPNQTQPAGFHCRRMVFERVLRTAAVAEPGVGLRIGHADRVLAQRDRAARCVRRPADPRRRHLAARQGRSTGPPARAFRARQERGVDRGNLSQPDAERG
jgi:hypothetical protein